MAVNVFVKNTFVFMDVGVHSSNVDVIVSGRESIGDPLRHTGKVKYSKEDQHQAYCQFHRKANARGNCQIK
jgi:plastocyanin